MNKNLGFPSSGVRKAQAQATKPLHQRDYPGNPVQPFPNFRVGQDYNDARRAMHDQFRDAMAFVRAKQRTLDRTMTAKPKPQAQQAAGAAQAGVDSLMRDTGYSDTIVEQNIKQLMANGLSRDEAIKRLRFWWGDRIRGRGGNNGGDRPGGLGGAQGIGGRGMDRGGTGPGTGVGPGTGGVY